MDRKSARTFVERLLDGRGGPRDLARLIALLRLTPRDDRRLLRDLADFAAHGDRRNQGLAWESLRDFARITRFSAPRLFGDPLNASPGEVAYIARAVLNLSTDHWLIRETWLSRENVERYLDRALAKFDGFVDDRLIFSSSPTSRELRVLRVLTSSVNGDIQYHDDRLVEEFADKLIAENLAEEPERHLLLDLKPKLAGFALEKMHATEFVIGNGDIIRPTLDIHNVPNQARIKIAAMFEVSTPSQSLQMGTDYFRVFSDPDLLLTKELEAMAEHGLIKGRIEVREDWRLYPLA